MLNFHVSFGYVRNQSTIVGIDHFPVIKRRRSQIVSPRIPVHKFSKPTSLTLKTIPDSPPPPNLKPPQTTMLTQLSPLHIPCLLTSLTMFLGGLFHGLSRLRAALLTWGMPPSIASSPSAQTVDYGHTMRTSTLGLLTLIVYIQGMCTQSMPP
ncbi:hypothetical protein BHYA_0107g00040 [Botrytis hyacinthi]|uniref:Uncharacterized protein n=1 Tax=Botrytis hyacinthi TaxID=278943 RepID=A0A4Z1GNQ4_9HELO|nr:hypothetical protein BHYA_0107g00040 [Botrytis hyacinthi]